MKIGECCDVRSERHGKTISRPLSTASSLGRELADCGPGKTREQLLAKDQVSHYLERARGGIYWSTEDRWGLSPLELVRRARIHYPDLFQAGLTKVGQLQPEIPTDIITRVPEQWMTPTARRFALMLISYNLEQLQRLLK